MYKEVVVLLENEYFETAHRFVGQSSQLGINLFDGFVLVIFIIGVLLLSTRWFMVLVNQIILTYKSQNK